MTAALPGQVKIETKAQDTLSRVSCAFTFVWVWVILSLQRMKWVQAWGSVSGRP